VSNRAIVSLCAGALVSTLCLWYAFRGVDLPAVARHMGRVGWSWVAGSILLGWLSLVVRAVRWRLLLEAPRRIGLPSLVSATFIGMMANNILPARIGEVLRAWVLARREELPLPATLASIVLERLLDVIAALAILGIAAALVPDLGGEAAGLLRRTGVAILGLAGAVGAALVAAVRYRRAILERGARWVTRAGRAWPRRLVEVLGGFLDGLAALKGFRQVTGVAALSLLTWAVAIAAFQVLAGGFHLGLTPAQMALVFVFVLFGVAIPSAPGFVGTFHGFCVAALMMVAGTDAAVAAAYATLMHGSQWLAVTVAGLGFFVADRSLSWSKITGLASGGAAGSVAAGSERRPRC
jgi:uncharacterized protein (TIRG00374 family)